MKNINLNLISDFLNEHAFSKLDKDLPDGGKQKFYENLDGILSQSFEQTLSEASLLESSYLEGQLNLDKTFSPPPLKLVSSVRQKLKIYRIQVLLTQSRMILN